MILHFKGRLNLNDIIGRLLGPDTADGYVVALEAEYVDDLDKTRVTCRPVAPDELKTPNVVQDRWGQPWLRKVMEAKPV